MPTLSFFFLPTSRLPKNCCADFTWTLLSRIPNKKAHRRKRHRTKTPKRKAHRITTQSANPEKSSRRSYTETQSLHGKPVKCRHRLLIFHGGIKRRKTQDRAAFVTLRLLSVLHFAQFNPAMQRRYGGTAKGANHKRIKRYKTPPMQGKKERKNIFPPHQAL